MKALVIGEVVQGKLAETFGELLGFAASLGAEPVGLILGDTAERPGFEGLLYIGTGAEYAPAAHKAAVLDVIEQEKPDLVVLMHSAYGWDLAPRIAAATGGRQLSEVISVQDGVFRQSCCNGKLQRRVKPAAGLTVVTLQSGAFPSAASAGTPVEKTVEQSSDGALKLTGYIQKPAAKVDLSKAEKIVSAGRGVGKPENIAMIQDLATALGAELGSSRPVVDAGWLGGAHQVGSTGSTVSPKLYIACGISGAVQHLAGMKKSELIIAVNKDKDAPISEVAQYMVVADLLEFVPALTEALK